MLSGLAGGAARDVRSSEERRGGGEEGSRREPRAESRESLAVAGT